MGENTMENGQLIKKILIEGTIEAITGLHIGGANVGMSIGGADNTVVRNPITNEPYIPGSSLKGKMRSLVEKLEGKFSQVNMNKVKYVAYVDDPEDIICKIFGTMPEKMNKENGKPTSRLIVRDCVLINKEELENAKETDMPYTEVKTEVVIDRITSAAVPRQIERVPAGAKFKLRLLLNIYNGDNEDELLNKVLEALTLVQNDYLGGSGTRGSGEVKITINKPKYKNKEIYEKLEDWREYENQNIVVPKELLDNNSQEKE